MNNISRRNFALLELSRCIKPSVGLLHYVVALHCPGEVLRKMDKNSWYIVAKLTVLVAIVHVSAEGEGLSSLLIVPSLSIPRNKVLSRFKTIESTPQRRLTLTSISLWSNTSVFPCEKEVPIFTDWMTESDSRELVSGLWNFMAWIFYVVLRNEKS